MKTEISAGGVIVRKINTTWQVLLMKDMNNAWTFPKGTIEKGETKKQAALREIGEEVGLDKLTYVAPVATIHYTYHRNGVIHKTVTYYLFHYQGNKKPVVQKAEGIKDAQWINLLDAAEVVGYPDTNAGLIKKTQRILSRL